MYFDKKKVIEKHIHINEKNIKSENAFHIAYGVDKNFLFGAAISMTSVIINNKEKNLNFHIFTDYIDAEYTTRATELSEKFGIIIDIYLTNPDCISNLPTETWPLSTYFRFIIFDFLSEKINKLLYLDADIICKGSISDIIKINLDNHFAAVVPDIEAMQIIAAERLNMPKIQGLYFNAGFLLMNLDGWKKNNLTRESISLLSDPEKKSILKYQDQDALNILLFGNSIYLPRDFNCIFTLKSELYDRTHNLYKNIIKNETIFIHYVGITKPWHTWSSYPSAKFFHVAHAESTWKDKELLLPVNATQWKKKSKHEFKQKKFIKGILSRLKFNQTR
ncbi:glycosyltransferase [Pectobacterium versatile]|uniref:glycosyltransferase n=1 Tax=Pectobacterium versatile TaxID=2488639 RepID=UPI000F652DE5|nr:glycosyltransferase [Pectobacterium versatile]AZK60966.1 lipopolysaccharide 1,2-glucosyltransferase [Pectobacterium versatile]UCP81534.1 lipopolysaccharide 1,2-glucosyltransferase [Pectobacterium versatile]